MRLTKIFAILPIAAVLLAGATPAEAQGSIGFGFSKFGKHSAFGVGFSAPLYSHRPYYVEPVRCWVPGHYETVAQQVWVPGCVKRVWCEPVYDTCVDPYGNTTRVLVRQGHYK